MRPRRPARCGLSSSASGAASASTTSTSWTRTSGRASSSSAPTSRIRRRVWLNGHEWSKRQADHAGIDYAALSNGFASCAEPERLQAICDSLAPGHVQAFFDRWMACIPTPLRADDRAAGYWWQLSIRQVEISRTLVFDDPRRARSFFEALVADNIGIGRPEQVSMVFARPLRRPAKTTYGTRVFTTGTDVRIDFRYKHCRIKQYLKDGRALRIETVINNPSRPRRPRAASSTSPELVAKARQVNQRLLIIERAGQSCAIGSALFERIHLPYDREGQQNRSLALRRHTRHGPGRRALPPAPRRRRLHQQDPARTRRRAPRPALQPEPDELRPAPTAPARPHPTPPAQQHLRPHPRRNPRRGLLHQAPRPPAATRCSTPTSHPPRSTSAARSPPSNAPSRDYILNARLAPAT